MSDPSQEEIEAVEDAVLNILDRLTEPGRTNTLSEMARDITKAAISALDRVRAEKK
jgi:hypothetical protein